MTEQQAIKIIKEEKSLESDDRKIDAFIMAIDALEEIKQYRAIGTPEECHEAVEKQKAKKPVEMKQTDKLLNGYFVCPICGGLVGMDEYSNKYCGCCGQKLDWGDEE